MKSISLLLLIVLTSANLFAQDCLDVDFFSSEKLDLSAKSVNYIYIKEDASGGFYLPKIERINAEAKTLIIVYPNHSLFSQYNVLVNADGNESELVPNESVSVCSDSIEVKLAINDNIFQTLTLQLK